MYYVNNKQSNNSQLKSYSKPSFYDLTVIEEATVSLSAFSDLKRVDAVVYDTSLENGTLSSLFIVLKKL